MAREAPVESWLGANEQRLEGSTMTTLVRRIRTELADQVTTLSDAEIEAVVRRYAGAHDIEVGGLIAPSPTAAGGVNLGAAAANISSALSSIPTEVGFDQDHGWALIQLGGPTVGLRSGRFRVGGTVGWSGDLNIESQVSGLQIGQEQGSLRFRGSLNSDRWALSLGFRVGPGMPDLSRLGDIFTEGESALRSIVQATAGMGDPIEAATEIGEHVQPVRRAMTAASQIARRRRSLSFTIDPRLFGRAPGGPQDQPPIGFSVSGRLTYRF